MKKLSKLLVMAIVMVAVVTMSLEVKAGTTTLTEYLNTGHNINGMILELTKAEKNALTKYINQYVDDATADSIMGDIKSVELLIEDTGAKKVDDIETEDLKKAVDYAKSACTKAGLTLSANTNDKTFRISKNSDGTVLTSGSYKNKIRTTPVLEEEPEDTNTNTNTNTNTPSNTDKNNNTVTNGNTTAGTTTGGQSGSNGSQGSTGGSSTSASTSTAKTITTSDNTLLYTGNDWSLYVVALLVIVAIAVIAKKRV